MEESGGERECELEFERAFEGEDNLIAERRRVIMDKEEKVKSGHHLPQLQSNSHYLTFSTV